MPAPRWSVYLLRCGDGSLYAGATVDLARRLARHAAGKGARYTRSRLPVVLAWHEPATDRGAALRREAALKRLSRAEKLALCEAGPRRPRRRAAPVTKGASATPLPRRSGGGARRRSDGGGRRVGRRRTGPG